MNLKWMPFLLAMTLAGCGTLTTVNQDGTPESELVWPDLSRGVTFDNRRGTYGEMDRIALIRDGATRDEIYTLIGRPQFSEGFHVREWDYVFYFRKRDGSELTCQYKILFDNDLFARNFYWKTVSPQGAHCPPQQNVTLSADALFRFDGGSQADLLDAGRAELDELANMLAGQPVKAIKIDGYTDRLGSQGYNSALSYKRAETVKAYLVARGVDGSLISASGKGSSNPVAICDSSMGRNELIACLQPNRRVEIGIER